MTWETAFGKNLGKTLKKAGTFAAAAPFLGGVGASMLGKQVFGTSPLADFTDWLTGANGDPGDPTSVALGKAGEGVTAATNKAMGILNPYTQGGQEDYANYRNKVNSGYYNTPMPGSYQPPAPPQNQAYNPSWNPQTQSFGQQRAQYQSPQMPVQQMQALPQWNPRSAPGQGSGWAGQDPRDPIGPEANSFLALLQKIKQGQGGVRGGMV